MLLDHGGRDKAGTTGPLLGRVVEDVVDLEAQGMRSRELVELGLEENVLGRDVGVDERERRDVQRVLERRPDDLLLV